MAEREFYSGKILYPAIVALLALSVLFGFAILPRLFHERNELLGKTAPDFVLDVVHTARMATGSAWPISRGTRWCSTSGPPGAARVSSKPPCSTVSRGACGPRGS